MCIGITKNTVACKAAHKKLHPDADFQPKKTCPTKTEARKNEQGGLDQKGLDNLRNKINSISKKNPKYKDYSSDKSKYQGTF
jgi:hypothetical protein